MAGRETEQNGTSSTRVMTREETLSNLRPLPYPEELGCMIYSVLFCVEVGRTDYEGPCDLDGPIQQSLCVWLIYSVLRCVECGKTYHEDPCYLDDPYPSSQTPFPPFSPLPYTPVYMWTTRQVTLFCPPIQFNFKPLSTPQYFPQPIFITIIIKEILPLPLPPPLAFTTSNTRKTQDSFRNCTMRYWIWPFIEQFFTRTKM